MLVDFLPYVPLFYCLDIVELKSKEKLNFCLLLLDTITKKKRPIKIHFAISFPIFAIKLSILTYVIDKCK